MNWIVYDNHVAMIRANLDKCNHHTYQNFRIECDGSGEAFRDSGDSTSICENEANQRLAATWLAGYGNQGIAILDANQHAPGKFNSKFMDVRSTLILN